MNKKFLFIPMILFLAALGVACDDDDKKTTNNANNVNNVNNTNNFNSGNLNNANNLNNVNNLNNANNVNNVNNVTPETVVTVCTKVMGCGGWGWEDQATCEAGFIDNPEYQTECADSAAYFLCMPTCMAEECTEFATCEGDCWTAACMAR